MSPVIYTIGHSTHNLQHFLGLLQEHNVTALVDVRSSPYSRHNPQFNREALSLAAKNAGVSYVFVGKELGARTDDPTCYEEGRVRYGRLARTPLFNLGIDRVMEGAKRYCIALMCAEKEPLDCHRTLLVSRALERRGASIRHILAGGEIEEHADAMVRLLDMTGLPRHDMFRTQVELIEEACVLREQRIAYAADAPRNSSGGGGK